MDFISNLLKRPRSLVTSDTATGTDTNKTQASTSLQNPSNSTNKTAAKVDEDETPRAQPKDLDLQKSAFGKNECEKKPSNNQPSLNLSLNPNNQSLNTTPAPPPSTVDGNLCNFIGVSDDDIGHFEEFILPHPPLPLHFSEEVSSFSQSLLEPFNDCRPSTPLAVLEAQTSLPSLPLFASPTIDELLLDISNNFSMAGINDELLAIAELNLNSELSPKTSLNSSKPLTSSSSSITHSPASTQMHTPRTPTTGSSSNSPVTFEGASPGAFDPELETAGIFDGHHQVAKELQRTSSVKKSSNKFVGLTAFDEDKIPDLPGDLNPNIEEQYSVTYEECFIPTLEAKQNTKSEFALPKPHLVLLNDLDTSASTTNEIFSDCLDDRDPLSSTFVEESNLCDTTSNGDGYESAVNDIATEIDLNQTHIVESPAKEVEYEDEPMDIDMNSTLEIIHKSAENTANVEKVLQHVENMLQQLDEEKENISNINTQHNIYEGAVEAKVIGSLVKPTESSKMTFIVNAKTTGIAGSPPHHSPHLEIEQSLHDVSLNKSVELPVKRVVTPLSSECVITAMTSNENSEVELKNPSDNLEISKGSSVAVDKNNTSTHSMDKSISSNILRCKSPSPKLNFSLNMNTSTNSVSGSPASPSPSFPIKEQKNTQTFPKSPKSKLENSFKRTFLEKSDYVENLEQKLKLKSLENQRQDCKENDSSLKSVPTVQTKGRRENQKPTETSDDSTISTTGMAFPAKTKSETIKRTFCIDTVSGGQVDKNESNNSRQTFNISSDEVQTTTTMNTTIEPKNETEEMNTRRTFNISSDEVETTTTMNTTIEPKNETEKMNTRRTFNISSDEVTTTTAMNTSIEPMDIDENLNQTTSALHEAAYTQEKSQSHDAAEINSQLASLAPIQSNDSTVLHNVEEKSSGQTIIHNISESPPLSLVQNEPSGNLPNTPNSSRSQSFDSVATQNRSADTPSLPTSIQNISNSPPLPAMQKSTDSPPLPTSTQDISNSPPLPAMQKISDFPPLPTFTQTISNSPPLPAMQKSTDSPPLPTSTQDISNSPPLPAMRNRSDSPPLPALKNRSVSSPTMEKKSISPPLPTQWAAMNNLSHLANQNLDGPLNKNESEKSNSQQTIHISSDEVQSAAMNTSIEPMDIDENLNQTTSELHKAAYTQEKSQSQDAAEINSQLGSLASIPSNDLANLDNPEEKSSDLPIMHNLSKSPPLSLEQNKPGANLPDMPNSKSQYSESKVTQNKSADTPPLPTSTENLSMSPPLPAMQKRSDSPPLPTSSKQYISNSPPLPAMQKRSDSPPLPTSSKQYISNSPPLPAMQKRSDSPPLPALKNRSVSPPSSTMEKRSKSPPLPAQRPTMPNQSHLANQNSHVVCASSNNQKQIIPSDNMSETSSSFSSQAPPVSKIQKRPSIHDYGSREILSAKEQSNTKVEDEKDELVEKLTPSSPVENMFTKAKSTLTTATNTTAVSLFDQSSQTVSNAEQVEEYDDEFQGHNNLILNPSDFDYLLTKGNNNTPVDRSSLLLKFDPLLGVPVSFTPGQQQQKLLLQFQTPPTTNNLNNQLCLSPTIEEDEHNDNKNRSFVVAENNRSSSSLLCGFGRGAAGSVSSLSSASLSSANSPKERSQEVKQQLQQEPTSQNKRQLPQLVNKKNATMSVDVIKDMSLDNNDCNKTFEHSNSTQSDDKQINYKMDELEKKIKNEVLKTEDIEKKLKDAEQREEALIKRITEKDKTVAKMNGVIEAYEKAIAELIAEKEQLIQNYEQQLAEVKSDRDSNYQHLTSLETTFSDLHVKYEKSKEMTCQLKGNEEALTAENRKNSDNLRSQEQRYDKMKNHALQQLEIANKKLECLTREHTMEITKLKALLKKEEIARSSMSEQLAQKTKENTELVKICDELIQGQGS